MTKYSLEEKKIKQSLEKIDKKIQGELCFNSGIDFIHIAVTIVTLLVPPQVSYRASY